MKIQEEQYSLKLCVDCFNCKTKNKRVYCKLGMWEEDNDEKSILYTPFDFDCSEWESS